MCNHIYPNSSSRVWNNYCSSRKQSSKGKDQNCINTAVVTAVKLCKCYRSYPNFLILVHSGNNRTQIAWFSVNARPAERQSTIGSWRTIVHCLDGAYVPKSEAHSLVRGCAHADDVTRRTLAVLLAVSALVCVCEQRGGVGVALG